MVLLIGIVVTIIVLLLCITVFGFVYTPNTPSTFINPATSQTNPVCSEQAVECQTNADCGKCEDNNIFEIRCEEMGGGKLTKKKKYCLPVKPEKPCNEDLGCVWTWTGWASSDNKEWESLCTYPEIAGNKGCTKLNPNVCKGGTYNYSAKHSNRGPIPSDCVCPNGSVHIVSEDNVPMCIPLHPDICSDESTCRSFYTSL